MCGLIIKASLKLCSDRLQKNQILLLHVGRKENTNSDKFYVKPQLYVVSDLFKFGFMDPINPSQQPRASWFSKFEARIKYR